MAPGTTLGAWSIMIIECAARRLPAGGFFNPGRAPERHR